MAIEKYCRLANGGYATVLDVDTVPVSFDDKQETFFLVSLLPTLAAQVTHILQSETLKYLYLTFADASVLPLHSRPQPSKFFFTTNGYPPVENVFNTEVCILVFLLTAALDFFDHCSRHIHYLFLNNQSSLPSYNVLCLLTSILSDIMSFPTFLNQVCGSPRLAQIHLVIVLELVETYLEHQTLAG